MGCTAASGSMVGSRFHVCVDVGRVRLYRVLRRRLLPPDSGMAGDDNKDHPVGPRCSRASSVHEKKSRLPFHINRIGPSLRCRKSGRIQPVVATPLTRRVFMGRPAGWLKELTGRSAMISPGAPATRRSIEREFWRKIAEGVSSEDAADMVGVSPAVG